MDSTATPDIFERLCRLLSDQGARFRIIEHIAEGRSEQIAAIRGNRPEQAAKAMVLQLRGGTTEHALAVLPGNRRLDFAAVAQVLGARKAGFAAAEAAMRLTGCAMGAVPPFSFDAAALPLLVEDDLLAHASLFFNAGRLDRSMELDTADWLRIARPRRCRIAAAA